MVFLVILWISFYRRELSTRGLLETFTCLFHLNQCQGLGVQTIVSKETVMSPNRSNFIHICSILFEDLGTGGRELSNCDLKYFYIKTSMAIFQVKLLCRKSGKTGRYALTLLSWEHFGEKDVQTVMQERERSPFSLSFYFWWGILCNITEIWSISVQVQCILWEYHVFTTWVFV